MDRVICKNGNTRPGKVNVVLQRDESTIIIKSVPADVCDNCGEYYLTEDVTGQIMERAEEAVKKGAEVEILRFAA
jgi:YgiT-type zinc finger domain-containing protein